jgi:hypothetical protein
LVEGVMAVSDIAFVVILDGIEVGMRILAVAC